MKRLMSYCQRAQVSCRLLYLQVPRLINKVLKLLEKALPADVSAVPSKKRKSK